MATVAVCGRPRGRSSTAVPGMGLAEATSRGFITIVSATAGHGAAPFCKAAARASTNAVADSQRSAGFLARPRRITASTWGLRAESRVLGAGGSRWTCA